MLRNSCYFNLKTKTTAHKDIEFIKKGYLNNSSPFDTNSSSDQPNSIRERSLEVKSSKNQKDYAFNLREDNFFDLDRTKNFVNQQDSGFETLLEVRNSIKSKLNVKTHENQNNLFINRDKLNYIPKVDIQNLQPFSNVIKPKTYSKDLDNNPLESFSCYRDHSLKSSTFSKDIKYTPPELLGSLRKTIKNNTFHTNSDQNLTNMNNSKIFYRNFSNSNSQENLIRNKNLLINSIPLHLQVEYIKNKNKTQSLGHIESFKRNHRSQNSLEKRFCKNFPIDDPQYSLMIGDEQIPIDCNNKTKNDRCQENYQTGNENSDFNNKPAGIFFERDSIIYRRSGTSQTGTCVPKRPQQEVDKMVESLMMENRYDDQPIISNCRIEMDDETLIERERSGSYRSQRSFNSISLESENEILTERQSLGSLGTHRFFNSIPHENEDEILIERQKLGNHNKSSSFNYCPLECENSFNSGYEESLDYFPTFNSSSKTYQATNINLSVPRSGNIDQFNEYSCNFTISDTNRNIESMNSNLNYEESYFNYSYCSNRNRNNNPSKCQIQKANYKSSAASDFDPHNLLSHNPMCATSSASDRNQISHNFYSYNCISQIKNSCEFPPIGKLHSNDPYTFLSNPNCSFIIFTAILFKLVDKKLKGTEESRIEIVNFFNSFCCFSAKTHFLGYFFLMKFALNNQIKTLQSLKDMFLTCCIVASKIQIDGHISNEKYKGSHQSKFDINYLEGLLLNSLRYNLKIEENEIMDTFMEILGIYLMRMFEKSYEKR